MKNRWLLLLPLCLLIRPAGAQTSAHQLEPLLSQTLRPSELTSAELRAYLVRKVPVPAVPGTAGQWTAQTATLRKTILDKIIFHGWPREWVDAPLKVEDLGTIPSGPGYRMRKLRYEIVPGFYSTAIVYEPESMSGKVPAILNVNGHVGPLGKAVEYKQKRSINQALQGILSLNLEWLSFGELSQPENAHWFAAHLDLVGANGVGLFYLAMRKGLDYLYQHPNVDRGRIGVTGLSGGGWQTIVLSSLDERVYAAAAVAGFSSMISRIERSGDVGDVEQNPADLLTFADYTHLTAMRAPRPTLLVYNAEDDCCFRGPLVKPYVFDSIRPFFGLYGQENRFEWHLNTDPSTHNYQRDNREAAYAFFSRSFGMPEVKREKPVDAEIKSFDELVVGLPKDNLTILGLARKMAAHIERSAAPSGAWLENTVRYQPVAVERAWALANSYNKGLESRGFRLSFSNGLSASAVWFKALDAPEPAPATIVLADKGRKTAAAEISDRLNRGDQVLALDLLFMGDGEPQRPGKTAYTQMLTAVGDRPLGLEAAQLLGAVRWLQKNWGAPSVRVETAGIRAQVAGLVAAALAPGLIREVVVRQGMPSLGHLLDAPVPYEAAPELFCLDLYRGIDLPGLERMAGSTHVAHE